MNHRLNKRGRTDALSTFNNWKRGNLRGRKASIGLAEKVPGLCAHVDELLAERNRLREAVVRGYRGTSSANPALKAAYDAIPNSVKRKLA